MTDMGKSGYPSTSLPKACTSAEQLQEELKYKNPTNWYLHDSHKETERDQYPSTPEFAQLAPLIGMTAPTLVSAWFMVG